MRELHRALPIPEAYDGFIGFHTPVRISSVFSVFTHERVDKIYVSPGGVREVLELCIDFDDPVRRSVRIREGSVVFENYGCDPRSSVGPTLLIETDRWTAVLFPHSPSFRIMRLDPKKGVSNKEARRELFDAFLAIPSPRAENVSPNRRDYYLPGVVDERMRTDATRIISRLLSDRLSR